MKQSSIEWLIDQLTEVDYGCINNTFLQMNNTLSTHIMKEIFEKAKAMHEEEIMSTFKQAQILMVMDKSKTAEQWYNETFNNEKF